MSTTAKASEHIKPCNIAQSERYNRRDADYIASLNPAMLYIRKDLAHLNEVYVAPDMEGVSLQQHYDDIRIMVKQKTGREMQEKDVGFTDKKGKQHVRQGCSPIREGVVNIKSDTTMEDLLRYAERVMRGGASELYRYTSIRMRGIMRTPKTQHHGNRTIMLISSGTGWTTTRASPSS